MEKLLNVLADGRFHSGEELGRYLGVSRAAVWKKLKTISDLGLDLEAVRGKGYRISGNLELLARDQIVAELPDSLRNNVGLNLSLITNSTNDDVRGYSFAREPWQVCITEYQSQGRGRRGRKWQSPFGASLYFSLLWKVESGLSALDGLSLAVGLTVLKTLESMGVPGLALKWPNDVLANGKKLAGVLLEISGDPTGACEIVIGIGVNLSMSAEQMSMIDQPVTDVKSVKGSRVSKNRLAARLIHNLTDMLEAFRFYGFTQFQQEWQRYDAYAGQRVTIHVGNRMQQGFDAGVSESGALLLNTAEGIVPCSGGEVSLRKQ